MTSGRRPEARRGRLIGGVCGAVILLVVAAVVIWIVNGLLAGVPGPMFAAYLEGREGLAVLLCFALPVVVMTIVGAVLTHRVRANSIGPILFGVGIWGGCAMFVVMVPFATGRPDLVDLSYWLGAWTFVPLAFLPVTVGLSLFPDGRPLSPAFKPLVWLGWLVTLLWCVTEATRSTLGDPPTLIPNPYSNTTVFRLTEAATLLGVPVLIGVVVSLVRRFRGSSLTVRQQVKWVAFGGGVEVAILLIVWLLSAARSSVFGGSVIAVAGLSGIVIPLTIGAAILKYRLYDIDHLVSRTISYVTLAAALAAAYGLAVIGLQMLLPTRNDFAVAAATLAAAAIFSPARRRIQASVERRFNRARYDSAQVIDAFGSTLGSMTDGERLMTHLIDTLDRTVAPSAVGVWVRPGP